MFDGAGAEEGVEVFEGRFEVSGHRGILGKLRLEAGDWRLEEMKEK